MLLYVPYSEKNAIKLPLVREDMSPNFFSVQVIIMNLRLVLLEKLLVNSFLQNLSPTNYTLSWRSGDVKNNRLQENIVEIFIDDSNKASC